MEVVFWSPGRKEREAAIHRRRRRRRLLQLLTKEKKNERGGGSFTGLRFQQNNFPFFEAASRVRIPKVDRFIKSNNYVQ